MPYLTAQEVAKAFQNGDNLQYNSKANRGAEEGWVSFDGPAEHLLSMLAENRCDFRVKARFEIGDFALVRSIEGVPRYANAFRKYPDALYVRVLEYYNDGTLCVSNGTFHQVLREDDLSPVEV